MSACWVSAFVGGAIGGVVITLWHGWQKQRLMKMVEANIAIMQSGHNLMIEQLGQVIADRDERIKQLEEKS